MTQHFLTSNLGVTAPELPTSESEFGKMNVLLNHHCEVNTNMGGNCSTRAIAHVVLDIWVWLEVRETDHIVHHHHDHHFIEKLHFVTLHVVERLNLACNNSSHHNLSNKT